MIYFSCESNASCFDEKNSSISLLNVKDCHSIESKHKISNSNLGKHNERKGKTFEEIFGEDRAQEIKLKSALSNKGQCRSSESKSKMSSSRKGKIPWNKGLETSQETKDKIKLARKKQSENGEPWTGKKRSIETKLKISNTLKNKNK